MKGGAVHSEISVEYNNAKSYHMHSTYISRDIILQNTINKFLMDS